MEEQELTQPIVEQQPTQESDADRNFRNMREKYERRIQELETRTNHIPVPAPEPEYDPYDDTFVDKKTLKAERIAQEKALKEIRDELAKVNNQTADMKLSVKYPDFYNVVNPGNLEKLSQMKPSHYNAVSSTADYFSAGEVAYDLIKTYVVPEKTAFIDKKIAENQQKPKASGSEAYTSNSPLAMAGEWDRRIITPERRAELRAKIAHLKTLG